ncbi:hypothetical protein PHISCL_03544 [Aspergillus sclerotialis]|uniref:Mediator of RNA polymerase II transcription subunit 7 n=1 Tax=Aspergillus sclerotialis TaxID=2070753 RepID=A0A3A2ZLM1_9EURO|nr:hypothetical protein PHISCL_03544 [Aspergillus sclerotialis]
MAEAGQPKPLPTAFAPPPSLWKHFTPENIKKLEEIKENAAEGKSKKWTPAELRALDLPPELRYLVPPAIPTESYSVFGELQSLSTALPSLKDQGIEQLYPSESGQESPSKPSQPLNHAHYLLKISKSLLLNFLEFVGILSVSPEEFEPKVDDMRNLFINAHHLLNLYRPHQARESLILMMEEQVERTKEEIQQMDKTKAEIQGFMEQLRSGGIDVDSAVEPEPERKSDPAVEDSRLVWDLLDRDT